MDNSPNTEIEPLSDLTPKEMLQRAQRQKLFELVLADPSMTLQNLAHELGVSISTINRMLNEPETRNMFGELIIAPWLQTVHIVSSGLPDVVKQLIEDATSAFEAKDRTLAARELRGFVEAHFVHSEVPASARGKSFSPDQIVIHIQDSDVHIGQRDVVDKKQVLDDVMNILVQDAETAEVLDMVIQDSENESER